MESIKFTAVSLCEEIKLNDVAKRFGIDREFEWAVPLLLSQENLKGIVNMPEDKSVFLFSFGSVVFLNFERHDMTDFVEYLGRIYDELQDTDFEYTDDYSLEIKPDRELSVDYDLMVVPSLEEFHAYIISTILAKSVAMDRIESGINQVLDDVEAIIKYLEKGHLKISDERLAKISGKILSFKYNTISYVMLLDKPDMTWVNEQSEELYNRLEELFELKDRYEKIRLKTETLLDITDVFTGLVHARRGARLDIVVIILIAVEMFVNILIFLLGGK